MNLLSDRIAIIVDVQDVSATQSGIVLAPGRQDQKQNTGVVTFTGPGRLLADGTLIAPSVKEGDKVLFTPFAGTTIAVNDTEYLIVREADIMAVID